MDLLSQIEGSLPLVLGTILVVAGLLALLLLALLSRARNRAQYTDPATLASSPGGGAEVVDLRSSPVEADLRFSFQRALELLRRYLPGRGSRYQIPWFMTFGQTAAGKTTALAFTELKLPFGEPDTQAGRNSPCLWWLFDRGVVLDVSGDLVLRPDGASSDQPAWNELLRQLREYRGRRPLDGLLLTIPVTELWGVSPDDAEARSELAHRAELLRNRLDQARQELSFQFPVYALVTQCDRLPGFADFAGSVDPGQLQEMFGWSNPSPPDVPYSDAWVDDAFGSVVTALDQQQLRVLQENRPLDQPQGFLSLPAAVDSLREALRIYWSQIFAGGDALPVRGLYFSGGEGFDQPGAAHDVSTDYRTWEPTPAGGVHRRVDFLTDLFSYKIFYEWTLARPVQEALDKRRRQRSFLKAALVLSLLAGPPLIAWSASRLSAAAYIVQSRFLVPAGTAVGNVTNPAALKQSTHTLLEAIDQVPSYRLRSLFLPASWLSAYSRDVVRAGTETYRQVIYPALAANLQEELGEVTGPVPVAPPNALIYDLPTVPEFLALEGMTVELDAVQSDAAVYDRFAAGPCATRSANWQASFQKLVESFDSRLRADPPTYEAERFYRDALCDAGDGDPFEARPDTLVRLQERVLFLSRDMRQSLFGGNVLVVDLDSLQRQLDDLSRQAPAPQDAQQVYQTLVSTIDRTSQDLADPRMAWAGKTTLDLGTDYEQLLGSIANSPYLGLELAQTIHKGDEQAFAGLRNRLAGYSTDATGPLLVQKDGAVQLQLTPTILGLRAALAGLLQNYSAPLQAPRLTLSPPAGTYLLWNAPQLTSAAGLLTSYAAFTNQSFKDYPGFRQIVEQSTQSGVELNVLDQVGQAQSFPALPNLATRALREAHLQTQVANLQGASAPLNQILKGFTKPPPVSGCPAAPNSAYCLLARTLLNQRVSLLQQVDALLADQGLYTATPGSLAAWDGQQNLAWSAFAVKNAAGLSAYLNGQRRIVEALNAQYATPILTAVPLGNEWGPDRSTPFERWSVIGSDLADYTAKAPNNALQTLEGFISSSMSGATTANCLELAPVPGTCFAPSTPIPLTANPPPCDYFLDAQLALQKGIAGSCQQLTDNQGIAAYEAIEQAFDANLKGRYPFAPAAKEPPAQSAELANLQAFYAVYDVQRPVVDRLLAASGQTSGSWPEARALEIRGFLDAMQKVRDFLAPPSAAGAATAAAPAAATAPTKISTPTYSLQVDLRPAPAAEAGGDQIITRTMQVGPNSVVTGGAPSPNPLLWSYKMPVQVSLRWALNSPVTPQAPANDPTARLQERTVSFTYADPWSLVRLLQTRPALTGDPAGASRFVIPVTGQETSEGGSSATLQTTARVFLRIGLATSDATQTPVTLPPFPTTAPPAR